MKLRIAFCLIGICLLGCEPKKPDAKMSGKSKAGVHAHAHDEPTSLPEAVKQLSKHVETISKAFTDKKPEDAHDSLHDFEHLLLDLPDLAKDLSDEKKAAMQKSADELLACYKELDSTLHGGPDTPFTEIGERLTAAMAGLKTATE